MTRLTALRLADGVAVVALVGSALWQMRTWPPEAVEGGLSVHVLLLAAMTVPLLFRHQQAVLVLVVVVTAAVLQYQLGGGLGQPFFAVLLALYSVGSRARYPATLVGPAVVALQVAAVDTARLRRDDPLDEVVPAWFLLVGVWGFGLWMRRRRQESVAIAERVEAAEREAADRTVRAVADERSRIARELHDLVAHSMGIIVVQAQGAQRNVLADPPRALSALVAIESTGRSGLAEMRRLLGLLSAPPLDGRPTGSPGVASTEPQPDLGQLAVLIDRVRQAGVSVKLVIEGSVTPLPPGIELSAYRVVQEALTNVLKHAGPVTTTVRLTYHPGCLDVEVTDTGTGPGAPHRPGHGLVGMRERVRLYGGSLKAGSDPGGGFRVHARFPLMRDA